MNKFKLFFKCLFLIYTLLYGCKPKDESEIKILEKLDEINIISEKNPDSAYYLLNLISRDNLTPDMNFRYDLLDIKLKVYLDLVIEQDLNSIRLIKSYFLDKNSADSLIALSYFYSGYINIEFNDLGKATEDFIKALEYSESFNTIKAKSQANIGYIYRCLRSYEIAKEWYNKSYNTYLFFDNNKAANSLVNFGDCMLLNNQPDSAIYYYQKAIELIGSEDVSFINNLIVALCHSNQYSEAKKLCFPYLSDTLRIRSKAEKHYLYMNMADIYLHTDKHDSAMYYINKIMELKLEDLDKLMALYQMGYLIEENQRNYRQALEFYKTYHNYEKEYLKDKSEIMIREMNEKYDNEKLINEKNQLIRTQNKILFFITICILCLFVILFYVMYKLKKTELSKKQTEIDKLTVLEEKKQLEEETIAQKKIIYDKIKSTQNLSKSQIDIIKQICEMGNKKTSADLRVNLQNIIEHINNDFIIEMVDYIDNTYNKEFIEKYSFLETDEVIICYLILLEFNNEKISLLLNLNEDYIYTKKIEISNKFGISSSKKIKKFIESNFRKLEYESIFLN